MTRPKVLRREDANPAAPLEEWEWVVEVTDGGGEGRSGASVGKANGGILYDLD